MARRRMLAGGLAFFLLIRLLPGFAVFWGKWLSLPLLELLKALGGCFPLVLLEYGMAAAGLFLLWSLFKRKLMRRLTGMVLSLAIAYLSLWYPLYFAAQPAYSAGPVQLAALCQSLIDELNASEMDFPDIADLPAKTARFPGWMEVLNISGFCSFFTGEAIVSPNLPLAALPFTAVHEQMHLQGIAGEGAANIAAWEACMELGGGYAASARLWALRYAMGELRKTDQGFKNAQQNPDRSMTKLRHPPDQSLILNQQTDRGLYNFCMQRMNSVTARAFRSAGGSYSPASPPAVLRAVCRLLGIERQVQDYEILAAYLAADLPG